MIDGLPKAGAGRLELVRSSVERTATAAKTGDALSEQKVVAPATPAAALAASGAPVDAEKVAAIRAAIAEGRYPVFPDRIAASMIGLDLPLKDGK